MRRFRVDKYIHSILLLLGLVLAGTTIALGQNATTPSVKLSPGDLDQGEALLYLPDSWLYHPGDSLPWARPTYIDTSWTTVSTLLGPADLPFINWPDRGWFRLHVDVDSALVGRSLAFRFNRHHGASEVYLDGEKVAQMGRIAPGDTVIHTDQQPHPVVFKRAGNHVLAVRFANPRTNFFSNMQLPAGFRLQLGALQPYLEQTLTTLEQQSLRYRLFIGALLAFTIIHGMLFLFYPAQRSNLFFALFTLFLMLLSFSEYQTAFTHNPVWSFDYYRASLIFWILTLLVALRFTYSLFYERKPRWYWAVLAVGITLSTLIWWYPQRFGFYRELFVEITVLEILRVVLRAFFRQREGVWIVGSGLGGFILGNIYTVAVNLDWMQGDPVWGSFYGAGLLIFSMSIYLSRNVARTNFRLEEKLDEVRHLSQKTLEQERENRKKELERRLLEAENERKSQELEEARRLQLSMLPRNVPDTDLWDIAVYMDTAQEVGGDYYDFNFDNREELTVALGDATGHGMKAGIMVATAKSYFHTLADENSNLEMLRRISYGIRNMDLRMMYLGLILMKLRGHQVKMTAAGMPPVLWYRADKGKVERITMKGLPLGAPRDFPYQERQVDLQSGDALLLMSDGLMELFNNEREMLGMERIERSLLEAGQGDAEDILNSLRQTAEIWSGGNNDDDITLMVLRAR